MSQHIASSPSEDIERVYSFWFGKITAYEHRVRIDGIKESMSVWFSAGKDPEQKKQLDSDIKEQYESLAISGREMAKKLLTTIQDNSSTTFNEEVFAELTKSSEWFSSPKGMISLIILFDQFSRNMYRGLAESYSFDMYALAISKRILSDRQLYNSFKTFEKIFLLLPLEHSENLMNQEQCIQEYELLVEEAPEDLKGFFQYFVKYARMHHDLIEKFGRFPFRNPILGRESTPEELESKISFL
ncbi:predicted protein [Naegleria gruberi]|uniref:Predicted protein n=1 Tax=Naegleria gruberi TaxID=5762 RepID=D2W3V2_NAEGR|nr:uncharacterized protein NAEGRDRAFT_76076 [Naegleria gruberi]EFC36259.1 predicted protein [Naegleria gruberi]|eukprot:XP_002669003.1 predicted protein [Naegleria gruberi strain NEG-M]